MTPPMLLLLLAFAVGAVLGFTEEHLRLDAQIAKIESTHAQALADAAAKSSITQLRARNTETDLRSERDQLDQSLKEALDHGQLAIAQLTADLRAAKRLSIPVRPATCASSPAAAGTAADHDSQSRADLTADAAEFLTGQAQRADDTALMLNSCIDQYETARLKLTAFSEGIR